VEHRDMQFMTSLFGGSENTILHSAFALGIVLAMIVIGLWLLKLLMRGSAGMGRPKKRVMVVDTATVDGKRQVVIIRRDNVEHLIMTGGPQDLIIESNIAAPEPAPAPVARRPTQRPAAPAQPAPAADIATPPAHERPVSREAVDRLRDLARPAPLKPRASLRHTALLRPVDGSDKVIPMGPELRVDNSAGGAGDSAKPAPNGNGRTPLGARSRLLRALGRGSEN
jgi:flagellar biogenesis protein FliO